MGEKEIGRVSDYFSKVGVIAVKLTGGLKVGDEIHVKGETTDYTMTVDSMQVNCEPIEKAKKGDEVGIKVGEKTRKNDKIFLVK